MRPETTVRLHYVIDSDAETGDYSVVSVTTAEPTPPDVAPVVRDTGRRVFQCAVAASDTLTISPAGDQVNIRAQDGESTSIYLTRESAYELGAALFALADTLRA